MIQDDNDHQEWIRRARNERTERGQAADPTIPVLPIIASLERTSHLSDRLSPFHVGVDNRRAFINFQAPPGHRYL
ncbi:hypothetical protein HALLA_13675 [Halostagnicola larsenii XH-48]|uniref:Uncharacterized protein n=1 Tax=Halostagnicola larsenii XH-48 TaxID=797299 RepID=W0JUM1_9EURY|nr:hypothetical protein HALLA_13675 [Halostagnicola larsenii XH-48]